MSKKVIIILILMVILASFFSYRVKIKNIYLDLIRPDLPPAQKFQNKEAANPEDLKPIDEELTLDDKNIEDEIKDVSLPLSYNLDIPFTSQAPKAIWDETFKEACEEAAALMVHYYYQNKQEITADTVEADILQMIDWQEENFGGHFDLTAFQTAQMIKEYWGYEKVEVIDQPSDEEIKYHLTNKRPVIMPTAGQELGNPYFPQPGPIYHMLVIKGYTDDEFISNDPGTKRGHNFLYSPQIIFNAMHDWNKDDILKGEKRIIVIYPN